MEAFFMGLNPGEHLKAQPDIESGRITITRKDGSSITKPLGIPTGKLKIIVPLIVQGLVESTPRRRRAQRASESPSAPACGHSRHGGPGVASEPRPIHFARRHSRRERTRHHLRVRNRTACGLHRTLRAHQLVRTSPPEQPRVAPVLRCAGTNETAPPHEETARSYDV